MATEKPHTAEEARKLARIKSVVAAPLWGMSSNQLRRLCIRGEIPEAEQVKRLWYVTPQGMDAYFVHPKSRNGRK